MIYAATAVVFAVLVGIGFFGGPADTPRLVVFAILLAIAAAKLVRMGLRRDDQVRTRRDDLEAGGLLVVIGAILVEASGGPASPLVPATFLLIALLSAQSDWLVSLSLAVFAAALEGAPVLVHGVAVASVGGWHSPAGQAGLHGLALLAFALGVGLFLRLERSHRLDAQRKLARFRGDTDELADDTEDLEDLKSRGTPIAQQRMKRLRELKLNLDQAIESAVRTARGALSAHTVLYLRLNRDGSRLAIADAATDSDELAENDLDPRSGIFAGAIKTRQAVCLADVRGAPASYYRRDVGVRSVLAVPVLHGDWVSGLLIADHLEPDRYGKTAADVLAGIARLIAELEHGGRERERHQKLQDQLTQLGEISKSLQKESLSPEELAKRALAASHNLADFDFAAVVTSVGDGSDKFVISTAMGVDEGRLQGKDVPVETLVGWVVRNRIYINGANFRDRTVKTPLLGKRFDPDGIRAALAFPMVQADRVGSAPGLSGSEDRGAIVGAIVFGSLSRDTFAQDEFEMLELIVNQTALVMSNAVLYRRMEELATTDGLTGLNNHRFFQESAVREVERAQRTPAHRFAVVLSDIDHFKKVNDSYGHPMGDEVLRKVGKILRQTIQRKTDLVARYGGEEFVLILADTDAAGARAVIDRVRAAVEKEQFIFEGTAFKVTMSAGVVAYPEDVIAAPKTAAAQTKQALIDRADKALYRSKEAGRNRSTLWSEIAPATERPPASSGIKVAR